MRKILIVTAALFMMISCTGKDASKKSNEDSVSTSDSQARIEAEQAEAEQVRMDSLRQDSIKKAELDALNINLFVSSFTEEGFGRGLELKNEKQISKALTNLGFSENKSVRTRTEEVCGDYQTWKSTKYTFNKTVGNETVIVEYEDEVEIIFPNSELKDKFIRSATMAGYKKSPNYSDKDGIFYMGPSDCYYRGTDITEQGNKVFITIRTEC